MTRSIDHKMGVSIQQPCIDKILAKGKDDNFHTSPIYFKDV